MGMIFCQFMHHALKIGDVDLHVMHECLLSFVLRSNSKHLHATEEESLSVDTSCLFNKVHFEIYWPWPSWFYLQILKIITAIVYDCSISCLTDFMIIGQGHGMKRMAMLTLSLNSLWVPV